MSLDIYLVDKIYTDYDERDELGQEIYWQGNTTHNLNKIAMNIGCYNYLWRPDEIGVVKAKDNINNLRTTLMLYYNNYERLLELEPSNGWGTLVGLIDFTNEYFKACLEYPDAFIEVSR